MEEQNQQQPKTNKTAMTVVISVILTAIVIGGGVFVLQQTKLNETEQNYKTKLNETEQNYKTKLNETEQKNQKLIAQLDCNWTWDEEKGCTIPSLTVISPKGDEEFCLGDKMVIEWQVSPETKFITAYLSNVPNDGLKKINTYKVNNEVEGENTGKGKASWDVSLKFRDVVMGNISFVTGLNKVITIKGELNGEQITASSEAFSITNCNNLTYQEARALAESHTMN